MHDADLGVRVDLDVADIWKVEQGVELVLRALVGRGGLLRPAVRLAGAIAAARISAAGGRKCMY